MLRSYAGLLHRVRVAPWHVTCFSTAKCRPLETNTHLRVSTSEAIEDGQAEKRKAGRPRKRAVDATVKKKKVGRSEPTADGKPAEKKPAKAKPTKDGDEDTVGTRTRTRRARVSSGTKTKQKSPTQPPIPPRLRTANASTNHHDLPTFLAHATTTALSTTSNVYKGTLYEYLVARTLSKWNFTLERTGRANDLGIDLMGYWEIPFPTGSSIRSGDVEGSGGLRQLKVILQCKAGRQKPQPRMVRELEGAYVGAPAGWKGQGVLALLVCRQEVTPGVRAALRRSRWPMGVLQVDARSQRTSERVKVVEASEGGIGGAGVHEVKQFLWNEAATDIGLQGLGAELVRDREAEGRVGLTWEGEIWKL